MLWCLSGVKGDFGMFRGTAAAGTAGGKTLHVFEFRGSGAEYFKIWIVNLALTIVTLGIYSAWAKVRTLRYLRGSTFLAGHPFDYHASPVRILIGRVIALTFLIAYGSTSRMHPAITVGWAIFFLFVTPWLVVSSLRFNARNTSYRNVRFNFIGGMAGAARVYILWPVLSLLTLTTTWPLAHRARDYYFVNNHTFGGRSFFTTFSGWSIYRIYLIALGLLIAAVAIIGAIAWSGFVRTGLLDFHTKTPNFPTIASLLVLYLLAFFVLSTISMFIHALSMNLVLNNTTLEGHELRCDLGPYRLAWIAVTNAVLVLLTIGLFYPWARVRMLRYEVPRFAVLAASDLDEFASETIAAQGAIGEEIASFFDLGISL